MEMYIITGKWPYARYGLLEYVNQRIVYIPNKDLKFCVDDRGIRELYKIEEITLERMVGKLDNSNEEVVMGHILRSKSTLHIFKKEIKGNVKSDVVKAYKDKDRIFFFKQDCFNKPSKK